MEYCERLSERTDAVCGQPAELSREYLAPEYPAADGKVHTHYYCSQACAAADAVALWGIGHDAVGPLTIIIKRRQQ